MKRGWIALTKTAFMSRSASMARRTFTTFIGEPSKAARHTRLSRRLCADCKRRSISIGVLAVCNPGHYPKEFIDFFTGIGINNFDILYPDATFDDDPPHIAQFYCDLFDLWIAANRDKRKLTIRSTENMVAGLLGGNSESEEIGYGPQEVCTILTDGSMEPLDVLQIAGDGSIKTTFNIFDNELEDIKVEPRWKAAREASLNLYEKCKQCQFVEPCGGGYLPHRFSKRNGYDNPSVYCDDLYAIFSHMQSILGEQVYVSKPSGEKIEIGEAIASARRAEQFSGTKS